MRIPATTLSLQCFCGRNYDDPVDLEDHRRARGHFPSHRCTSSCKHPPPIASNRGLYPCIECQKPCETEEILKDHQIARGHGYCSKCHLKFDTAQAAQEHRMQVLHASEFKCCDCNRSFKSIEALLDHIREDRHLVALQKGTKKKVAQTTNAIKNQACGKCPRKFATQEALLSHENSVKHKPLSNLSCPVGKGCGGKFTSPSALMHHLESGKCSSGLNRGKIYEMVHECDTNNLIHHKLQIANTSSSFSTPITTPPSSSGSWVLPSDTGSDWSPILTPTISEFGESESSEQWSLLENSQVSLRSGGVRIVPTTLHCTLCPPTRKPFQSVLALEQHLASAAHSSKVYHCPSNLMTDPSMMGSKKNHKEKSFSTLSGMAQHLESGACRGGKKAFLQCMDIIQGHLKMFGLGGLKLLVGT